MSELHIAEIPYEDGGVHFRYARKMAADGHRWLRHGLFQAFHANGQKASEGHYRDGVEEGVWRDFNENGQTAAEGRYAAGEPVGVWMYWDEAGRPQVR